ncbi:MAG: trypsin-like peptidase domain-containing protein [Anaerolineae bacterium]|nr:trypsin-like peptidase domain-containing protein [Anaerolineae bacterium]
MSLHLDGKQYEQFWKALQDAYDLSRLQRMVQFKLDKRLDQITAPGSIADVTFDLIRVAEMEGWTDRLLLSARESNPGNAQLLAFSQQFGLTPGNTPAHRELEKMLVNTNSFLNIAEWRERLGAVEGRVCRVEIQNSPYGTGFLLGPDLVMTNYHVVKSVIEGTQGQQPGDVSLRFDYKRLADGTILNQGKVYGVLAGNGDWLVDHSPYSPVDLEAGTIKSGLPAPDQLDYALLRVDGAPGDEAIGEKSEPGAPPRGWIEVKEAPYDFPPGTPLFIVQHPKGAPLQLALDTKAVIGVNANNTRVTYRTNTEPGSSGSPVFDQNWNLVALHHSGDPDSLMPAYNEGVPLSAIVALLKERQLGDVFGGG